MINDTEHVIVAAQDGFLDQVHALKKNKAIIIALVNKAYYPLFELWYSRFSKLNIHNYLIVSLDRHTHLNLQNRGINTRLVEIRNPRYVSDFFSKHLYEVSGKKLGRQFRRSTTVSYRQKIWRTRVEILKRIIDSGVNVIHTDIDAIWRHDILPYIESIDKDLIISIAHGMPKTAIERWGFSLCCGFYMLRSNDKTQRFVDDYLRATIDAKDDQVALNNLIMDSGIRWVSKDTTRNEGNLERYGLHIHVLDEGVVSRKPVPNAYVYHPVVALDAVQRVRKIVEKLESTVANG
jgi:Nucleotide-diphospho-sugar transferase